MRRLLLLLAAFVIALLALRFGAGLPNGGVLDGIDAAVRLRDGVIIALVATVLAAWVSAPYPYAWNQTTWTTIARALVGSGITTAIVALGLNFFPIAALPNLSEIVWAVGMIAVFVGIALPATIVRFAPPVFTWAKGRDGAPIRKAVNPHGEPIGALQTGRGWWIALALVIALGAGVRIWYVNTLPPVCLASGARDECGMLLSLVPEAERLTSHSVLLYPITRGMIALGGWLGASLAEPLWALRWATALVGILCLPALAFALRPLSGPAGILLGVALFAVHPLFVELNSTPLVESVFWVLLAVAGSASALRSQNPRGWALTGLALGLLILCLPAWSAVWLLWLVICLLVTVVRRPLQETTAPIALMITGIVAGAAISGITISSIIAPFLNEGAGKPFIRLAEWIVTAPTGTMGVLALAAVGIGGATRLSRVGIQLLAMAAIAVVAGYRSDAQTEWLLVFAALFAAIALDQLVRSAQRAWTPIISPAKWLAAALVLLVGVSGYTLYQHERERSNIAIPVDDQAALATLDFMQLARTDPALDDATWLLAPSLFAHGGIRSATAPELSAGRLLPFAGVADLPFAGSAPGGLVYVLPASDLLTLEILQAVYPEGRTLPLANSEDANAIRVWRVDPAVLFDSTGLAQFVYEGSEFGSADEAALSLGVGPLHFAWGSASPRPTPFSVEWSGSLLARTAGEYEFAVLAPADAVFSMTLDDRLILDTSLGLTTRTELLPEGTHRLEMHYRSGGAPEDLTITWRPPGEEAVPIPREALYNPAIPDMGLLGVYTAGSAWDGTLIAQRKDLQIVPDATLEMPWGVVWQGFLAAPRAGEYLIGAVTNGTLFVDVDGKRLITHTPNPIDVVTPPTEGAIYLEQGWTPVTIRFAPDANKRGIAPEMRLYWQPPGGEPNPLRTTFFTPAGTASETTRDLPMLPAPDSRLGDDTFALSIDSILWAPQVRIPPSNLPLLPFENVERWGFCGVDEGQFSAPHGIAWDAATETIYIADTGNVRVVALNTNTGATQPLPIPGLEEPVDVALTPEGRVLILDTAAPKLALYDPQTGQTEMMPLTDGFYRPRGVAVDGGGIVYIADTGGARIAALTPEGGLLTAFGGTETRLGRGQPAAVATTARALWAVSAEDGRLWQLNTLGSLTAIQPTDTINGPHIATFRPAAAIDAPGSAASLAATSLSSTPTNDALARSLFVTDPARHMVTWFAESGQPLGALADEGAFDQPTGIAVIQRSDETLLAVMDTARCEVSTWRAVTNNLTNLLP